MFPRHHSQPRSFARQALPLALCALFLLGCATPTPAPPPPARIVVVHPPLPSTICFDQPAIPVSALVSEVAFKSWFDSEEGRHFLRSGRESGHDCFTKLMAIGAEEKRWAAEDMAKAEK